MSNVKKSKPMKIVKVQDPQPAKPEPKKRPSRAKPKPTKEETIKMLTESSCELKQIIHDLKDDECKLQGLGLKHVRELVKETISNLEEDVKELDQECKEISSQPEEQPNVNK